MAVTDRTIYSGDSYRDIIYFTFSWGAAEGADGYSVYRHEQDGSLALIADLDAAVHSCASFVVTEQLSGRSSVDAVRLCGFVIKAFVNTPSGQLHSGETRLGEVEDTLAAKAAAGQSDTSAADTTPDTSPVVSGWNTFTYYGFSGAEFSTIHENGNPVLSVANNGSGQAVAEKYFALEPDTDYKVSVRIKTQNLISEEIGGGASFKCLLSDDYPSSGFINVGEHTYSGNRWQDFILEFNSSNHSYLNVRLSSTGKVSGEMFFSDLKIEKKDTTRTNEWNYLVLIYKNIAVDTIKDGKPFHYEDSLNDRTTDKLVDLVTNEFPDDYEFVTNNRIKVANVHVEVIDEPLEIESSDSADTGIQYENEDVQRRLEGYENIHEVITIAPLQNLGLNYWGRNITAIIDGRLRHPFFVCVATKNDDVFNWQGKNDETEFATGIFIHETLHSVEGIQRYELGLGTHWLDYLASTLNLNPNDPWITREGCYAQGTLPDGKGGYTGLIEEAFYVGNGDYVIIHSDSMNIAAD
jgi:hypothetical protein